MTRFVGVSRGRHRTGLRTAVVGAHALPPTTTAVRTPQAPDPRSVMLPLCHARIPRFARTAMSAVASDPAGAGPTLGGGGSSATPAELADMDGQQIMQSLSYIAMPAATLDKVRSMPSRRGLTCCWVRHAPLTGR